MHTTDAADLFLALDCVGRGLRAYSLLDLGPIAREGGHCSNTCTTTTWIMFGGFQFPNAIFLCIVLLGRGPRKNCKNDLDDQI